MGIPGRPKERPGREPERGSAGNPRRVPTAMRIGSRRYGHAYVHARSRLFPLRLLLGLRLLLVLREGACQFRYGLEQIGQESVVSDLENGGLGVTIDGHHHA